MKWVALFEREKFEFSLPELYVGYMGYDAIAPRIYDEQLLIDYVANYLSQNPDTEASYLWEFLWVSAPYESEEIRQLMCKLPLNERELKLACRKWRCILLLHHLQTSQNDEWFSFVIGLYDFWAYLEWPEDMPSKMRSINQVLEQDKETILREHIKWREQERLMILSNQIYGQEGLK